MMAPLSEVKFIIGARKLFGVKRRLQTVAVRLPELTTGFVPVLPPLGPADDGYRILSAPAGALAQLTSAYPDYVLGGIQYYQRHYIDMAGSFSDYLAQFSSKTRATLRRKQRKLAELSGGQLDVRCYRTPAELTLFLDAAAPLSRLTYQTRLLDAGLPEDAASRAEMLALAAADRVRAYLLWCDGRALSYLYLPVQAGVIDYAYLGYDPAVASLSPGTVLQLAALEQLYQEGRYRYFDFTEGEGAHKALFGTAAVAAYSCLLLKPGLSNRLLLSGLDYFGHAVALGRSIAVKAGIAVSLRRLVRG
jgi:CelD/BcsL family acetyltransferase involved in cellulose biosynthesis